MPTFRGFWGTFPSNDVLHCPNTKNDTAYGETCRLSHNDMLLKISSAVQSWLVIETTSSELEQSRRQDMHYTWNST